MLVEMELLTEEQQQEFIDGFEAAGGYVGDLESPFPLCAPWYHSDYEELDGDTPAEWGASYWAAVKTHAIPVLKEEAEHFGGEALEWLEANGYPVAYEMREPNWGVSSRFGTVAELKAALRTALEANRATWFSEPDGYEYAQALQEIEDMREGISYRKVPA